MSQPTINAFFNVQKRAADQHAAKKRKVILDEGTIANLPKSTGEKLETTRVREQAKVIVKSTPVSENEISTHNSRDESSSLETPSVKEGPSREVCTPVVTSIFDDHIVGTLPVLATPKSSSSGDPANKRQRKRDALGAALQAEEEVKAEQPILFTLGKQPSTVRKRLDMTKVSDSTKKDKKVALFQKLGQLSPQKKVTQSPVKNVAFEKLGSLSPVKKGPDAKDLSELRARAGKLLQSLTAPEQPKLTPQQVKAKLGTVTKLSDLQSKLKLLSSPTLPSGKPISGLASHRRALFAPPSSPGPKLSQDVVTFDVVKEMSLKPPPSPIKASPRKAVLEGPIAPNLPQPDKRLPLPKKYKFLAEVFEIVDQIVSMKHNRHEMIRVCDVKPAAQNVLRKTFGDDYLKQIRCVFPAAYKYAWERVRDRMNRDTNNFELHMETNLIYDQKDGSAASVETEAKKKIRQKITPVLQVERLKIFKHNLLTIVEDHHHSFLKENGIFFNAAVTSWHKDFDVESLPDVDMLDFPPKPHVDKVTTAQDMIQRLGSGLNPRLENVLKQRSVAVEAAAAETATAKAENKTVGEVKILKGLQGLSPQLLEMLKAREKAKQIKSMTQSSQEQKELEMMEELIIVAPYIVNCHRSQRNGAAVPSETLFKITSSSYGRKTVKEMEELVRLFLRLVPECMEVKSYEKVEYIKQKKPSPDINQIRVKLEKMVEAKKNAI